MAERRWLSRPSLQPAPARVKRPVCGNVGPNVGAQSQSGVDRATTTSTPTTTTTTATTPTDEGSSRAGAGPAAVGDEGGGQGDQGDPAPAGDGEQQHRQHRHHPPPRHPVCLPPVPPPARSYRHRPQKISADILSVLITLNNIDTSGERGGAQGHRHHDQ